MGGNNVTNHPIAVELEGFARGTLSCEQTRTIFQHLLQGCGECHAALARSVPFLAQGSSRGVAGARGSASAAAETDDGGLTAVLVGPRSGPRSGKYTHAVYEVARSAEALVALQEGGLTALAAHPDVTALIASLALIRHARRLRHEEAAAPLVEAAQWAVLAARALDRDRYGAELVADLQARAWAELGNAYRIADELLAAEQALADASMLARRGSGAPLLRALVLEYRAALYSALRRFSESFSMLDAARALYNESGEPHQVGRVLISKGLYASMANDLERGIRFLQEGLVLIDEQRDPKLVLYAVHNIAYSLAELGRYVEARTILRQNRERYELHGGRKERNRLAWVEGTISAGLGELEAAERCLLDVRATFRAVGARYDHALVSLDLAAVWLRQGQTLLARQLVEDAALVLRGLGIARDALAAVLVLQRAFELEVASIALLQPVASYLRRLARDPGARFEPGEG